MDYTSVSSLQKKTMVIPAAQLATLATSPIVLFAQTLNNLILPINCTFYFPALTGTGSVPMQVYNDILGPGTPENSFFILDPTGITDNRAVVLCSTSAAITGGAFAANNLNASSNIVLGAGFNDSNLSNLGDLHLTIYYFNLKP